MAAQKFDFETYVIETLKEINETLKGLGNVYMPREEIMLLHKQTTDAIDTLKKAVDLHTKQISALIATDNRQQGAIDAKKSMSTMAIALIAAVGALIGGIATGLLVHIGLKNGG